MARKVRFVSQVQAEAMHSAENWAMISITDPGCPMADLKDGWPFLLRVQFHDIDRPMGARFDLITSETAKQIVDFVAELPGDLSLVVHCHAGASRSAAVALVAATMLKATLIGNTEAYNQYVFNKLRLATRLRLLSKPRLSYWRAAFAKHPALQPIDSNKPIF